MANRVQESHTQGNKSNRRAKPREWTENGAVSIKCLVTIPETALSGSSTITTVSQVRLGWVPVNLLRQKSWHLPSML